MLPRQFPVSLKQLCGHSDKHKLSKNSNSEINNLNLPSNIQSIVSKLDTTEIKLDDSHYSKERCSDYTRSTILDENNPENGGIKCLKDYIIRFGERIEPNKYLFHNLLGS